MAEPKNQAAWLLKAGEPLQVLDAPMPVPGPNEIIVKNAAIALNPLDCHMQDAGVFVQQWPTIFGCDVAGVVHEVGPEVTRFKKGDRVIGHPINLTTGRPQDGAYALYTTVPDIKAAILPASISFADGVVVPFALESAVCALSLKEATIAMFGIMTPALGLPYPTLTGPAQGNGKLLVVYGGSSSVGSMTTQLATVAGVHIISICGANNLEFSKRCGAAEVFNRNDSSLVDKVVKSVTQSGLDFVGIFDAVSTPETYAHDLSILARLGGGHLACVHFPPAAADVPANVKAGVIFAVNDIATPVWRDYVTPALEAGKILCLPAPTVVGKGLEFVNGGLVTLKAGVSATKLVVEL